MSLLLFWSAHGNIFLLLQKYLDSIDLYETTFTSSPLKLSRFATWFDQISNLKYIVEMCN